MGRDNADQAPAAIAFESVGIGRAGEGPADYVPLDSDAADDAETVGHRARWITVGVGVVALLALIGWVTLGRGSPAVPNLALPAIPSDPAEAFTWTTQDPLDGHISVGGSADTVIVLSNNPDGGSIVALNADGSERWRTTTENFDESDAVVLDDAVVTILADKPFPESGGAVTVARRDAQTGAVAWETEAPGTWSFAYDDHIVVANSRSSEASPDSASGVGFLPGEGPTDLVSIDLATGHKTETMAVDSFHGGDIDGLLVTDAGEATFVDGQLRPTSSPVPVGDGFVGAGHGQILTLDDSEVVLTDVDGTVINSVPVPGFLDDGGYYRVSGAGDVWFYTNEASFTSGAFRFGPDGDVIELWHHEDSLVFRPLIFSTPNATEPAAAYAIRVTIGGSEQQPDSDFISLTSGDVVLQGRDLWPGANGVVAAGDDRAIGYLAPNLDADEPTFGLRSTDTAQWYLLDGALAVVDSQADDTSMSVTVYATQTTTTDPDD